MKQRKKRRKPKTNTVTQRHTEYTPQIEQSSLSVSVLFGSAEASNLWENNTWHKYEIEGRRRKHTHTSWCGKTIITNQSRAKQKKTYLNNNKRNCDTQVIITAVVVDRSMLDLVGRLATILRELETFGCSYHIYLPATQDTFVAVVLSRDPNDIRKIRTVISIVYLCVVLSHFSRGALRLRT